MKKYFNAEMRIVSVSNNDIVTASIGVIHNNANPIAGDAPERRRSIWD